MWWRQPINVKRCAHYQTKGTESFILIAWKLQVLGRKNLLGGPFDPTPLLERVFDCKQLQMHVKPTYGVLKRRRSNSSFYFRFD